MKPVSLAPKYASYYPDGLGRDMYINYNNGGFLKKGVKIFGANRTFFKPQPHTSTHISAYINILTKVKTAPLLHIIATARAEIAIS
jgi:hypothetical protein